VRAFIPDPRRWACVGVDWYAVMDCKGFVLDLESDETAPVVTGRKHGGASVLDNPNGYWVLVPRWDGIVFGREQYHQRWEAPAEVTEVVLAASKRYSAAIAAPIIERARGGVATPS